MYSAKNVFTKLKKLRNAPQNLLAVPRLAPVQVASAKKCHGQEGYRQKKYLTMLEIPR